MRARLSALWVRNVIGTIVTAAAIGVLIFTGLGESWAEYRHTIVPGAVVPAGQSGDAEGLYLEDRRDTSSEPEPGRLRPEAAARHRVNRHHRRPRRTAPTDGICNGVITDGERRWKNEGIGGFQPPATDGVTTLCSQPGLLQFTFLLPHDAVPTAMDVVQFDGRITVRLLL